MDDDYVPYMSFLGAGVCVPSDWMETIQKRVSRRHNMCSFLACFHIVRVSMSSRSIDFWSQRLVLSYVPFVQPNLIELWVMTVCALVRDVSRWGARSIWGGNDILL